MKLLPTQIDEASLLHLGEEAVSLLEKREFQLLADRFGYALAFGRRPSSAIAEELHSCVAEFRASFKPQTAIFSSTTVKYFNPNDSGLFAVIECECIASEGCLILAELIVASAGENQCISLEQISLVTV